MDPARKRTYRLVAALSVAVLLATALVYTSFSASTEARQPSELLTANPDQTYDLTGKVVDGSVDRDPTTLRFEVADRDGGKSVPVTYTGTVPDPFREGREVVVTGAMRDGTFVAEEDSLVTKCPSKFSDQASAGN
ncbi:MAG: cytochrome c maturation protein CcmE [Solirubrobacterales bacterium]